jgi:hypothetical protein
MGKFPEDCSPPVLLTLKGLAFSEQEEVSSIKAISETAA